MGTITATALRPLTDAERRAVTLMDDGADIEDVMAATRLRREQIVAARDLASLWRAVGREDPGTPQPAEVAAAVADVEEALPVEGPVFPADGEPQAEEEPYVDAGDDVDSPAEVIEPEPDDGPASVADEDVVVLLASARDSQNPRAAELLAAVDRHLAELRGVLEADERTRVVREEIARLEGLLAAKRLELERISCPA